MSIKNQEALQKRADGLKFKNLNGLKSILIKEIKTSSSSAAILELHFYNNNDIENIFKDFDAAEKEDKSATAAKFIHFSGGHRTKADLLKIVDMKLGNADNTILTLTVSPIGDYSTYTLSVEYKEIMDPLFSEIDFKFRPGCFNTNCKPEWKTAPEPKKDPSIDYLAKDYDSFKHTMIAAMMERVPGWQPTSEADLDQAFIELFSAAADELSDYQDRVINEAYLPTARKRVSLARHARLMDYHIHQGNQASTWLVLNLKERADLNLADKPLDIIVWSGSENMNVPSSVIFSTCTDQYFHYLLNKMDLYTWRVSKSSQEAGTLTALDAGSTMADLRITGTENETKMVRDLINNGEIKYLLIKENFNPATGEALGRDPNKRQLLKLRTEAKALKDPVTDEWFLRVLWEDGLRNNYCFTVYCPDGSKENISYFQGNLVEIYHGRPVKTVFKEPIQENNAQTKNIGEFYFERTKRNSSLTNEENGENNNKEWVICRLPESPLAYRNTSPGGEQKTTSTLDVTVKIGSVDYEWNEEVSLVHSDDSDKNGNHFVVETDEDGRSLIRFGDGINGKKIPYGSEIHCFYQIGRGLDGNIGRDKLFNFDKTKLSNIESCYNPFNATNGRDPEPVEEIIRRIPEAYRSRQLRAVTLNDYVNRAQELGEVSRAVARYVWTGSWRSVHITIDPAGTDELKDEVRDKIMRDLDSVRLIGEDLEIRPPKFVPLRIDVLLCVHPDYWAEDIKSVLEQEFSNGYTTDRRKAFFHPDLWTFGQEIRRSQIIGRVQSIMGVDHVVDVIVRRWGEAAPQADGIIKLRPNEIIQVKNDPNQMETGYIFFDVKGGRQ